MTASSDVINVVVALTAPLCLAVGLTIWDQKWTGHPVSLNCYKCVTACFMFIGYLIVAHAVDFDFEDESERQEFRNDSNKFWPSLNGSIWLYLLLSGTIGITIGDNLWLYSLQLIGSRRLILVDSTKPFCATLLGYIFLDEGLTLFFVTGLIVTASGVTLTGWDSSGEDEKKRQQHDGVVKPNAPVSPTNLAGFAAERTNVSVGTRSPNLLPPTPSAGTVGESLRSHQIGSIRGSSGTLGVVTVEVSPTAAVSRLPAAVQVGQTELLTDRSHGASPVTEAPATLPIPTQQIPDEDKDSISMDDIKVRESIGVDDINMRGSIGVDDIKVRESIGVDDIKSRDTKSPQVVAVENPEAEAHPEPEAPTTPLNGDHEGGTPSRRLQIQNSMNDMVRLKGYSAFVKGYVYAFINVFLDVIGALLIKIHGKQLDSVQINLVRFGVAAVSIGVLSMTMKQYLRCKALNSSQSESKDILEERKGPENKSVSKDESSDDRATKKGSSGITNNRSGTSRDTTSGTNWYELPHLTRQAWIIVTIAVFFVTFSAPICATYVLFRMPMGVVLSLTSTGPLFSLPVVYFLKNEVVSWKGKVGAFITVAGVFLLCLSL